ncbi:MAG: helix-turn-helix domain-containing protein [Bacteroidota bacterium]
MTGSPHIGRNISRLRELRGMKQEALADALGVSQQAVSKIEQSEKVEETTLARVAKALGVPEAAIKNFNEEDIIYNIQNNYEGSNPNAAGVMIAGDGNMPNCTFNPLDKMMEVIEENKKLYERLLASEQEKAELLKKVLDKK